MSQLAWTVKCSTLFLKETLKNTKKIEFAGEGLQATATNPIRMYICDHFLGASLDLFPSFFNLQQIAVWLRTNLD